MGRLFWKILLGFWLTLLVSGAGIALVVYVYNQARWAELDDVASGPRAEITVAAAATALANGGPRAVAAMFARWPGRRRPPVLMVDRNGRDLWGRVVPHEALARARAALDAFRQAPGLRRVTAPDGREFVLFIPAPDNLHERHHRDLPFLHELLAIRLGAMALASLLFSAGLAWYLTRPIRHLREASRRLAEGDLETRVVPVMGKRRDELGGLGEDFDHMAGRLQALVRAQKRLLHDVSHELRSPLARLRVAVGLARQRPERLTASLDRIEREAERLDELVGQVLTLSRLEAGVSETGDDDVDLAVLLEEVVSDVAFEAEASGRKVHLRAQSGCVVEARAELLHRAFENVIRNAVKYTQPDTAVEVTLQRDAGLATVTVCDRGPGVAAADQAAIFEPFFRGAAPPTARSSGYGLGLAIAKRAVEACSGTIRARNSPQGGLCIAIELPLSREHAPHRSAPDSTRPA